ncbi:MAG: type II secretion system GspH family protein [Candidatus Omnitrophica bacterium]|nr:type II secretion system GspH family protein [Candidatus Omnitrophota bacterium]MBU4488435.1 type II secretion system GspH family protein [Candidatus Omnitrophota bacterium]MCG2705148.1 type II secretion system GspH family protein [Candidatus Omnitrophota bacterium]
MKCRNSGITLVETLMAVMILSVLALSLYTVFKSGIDAWTKSESRLEIYQNARAVLDQISRELAGAFVDGADAKLVGAPGVVADELVFVTDFADSIYKIKYYLMTDAADTTKTNLMRAYIDYSDSDHAGEGYDSINYEPPVEFVKYTKSAMVDDIQFTYLPQITKADVPVFLGDWSDAARVEDIWSDDDLPEAVKIVITMKAAPYDPNGATYDFETIVYLPNSETE